ncbi:MAG: hypothetical protein KDK33_17310 [Leptospiraceae bacterium]|nr:hypothetical protein [Leptospiraceae bacterium]
MLRIVRILALSGLFASAAIALWLGIDYGPLQESGLVTLTGVAIVLIFLFLFSVVLELFYHLVRIPGALLLRIEGVWNFAAPAIALFLLTAEPLIRWSGLADAGPVLHFQGPALWLAAGLFGLLLLLFIFPLFRGMNASLMLAGVVAARFILLPVQNHSILDYVFFETYAIGLSFLIFLYLQSRRRIGLSPEYETFHNPQALLYIPFFLPFLLIGLFFWVHWALPSFPAAIPTVLMLFLAAHWWVSGLALNMDARASKAVSPVGASIVVSLFTVAWASILLAGNIAQRMSGAEERSRLVSESLTFFAAFLDRDRDGNSRWPGLDPDDSSAAIRYDFANAANTDDRRAESDTPSDLQEDSNVTSANTSASESLLQNRRLLTIVVPEEAMKSSSGSLHILNSNDLAKALQKLLGRQGALEKAPTHSVLTQYVDAGYRTVCTGNGTYFSKSNPARLDTGCQVFEPVPSLTGRVSRDQLESFFSSALLLHRKYREKNTFTWIHLDLSGAQFDWKILPDVIESWWLQPDYIGSPTTALIVSGEIAFARVSGDGILRFPGPELGFVENASPGDWSRSMHEVLGSPFAYPFESFGLDSSRGKFWIRNQMTGESRSVDFPWQAAPERDRLSPRPDP